MGLKQNSCTHDYKTIKDNRDGLIERCYLCKKRLITKKDPQTGRIDNRAYLKEHNRWFAQPVGKTSKTFRKVYASHTLEEIQKEEDWRRETLAIDPAQDEQRLKWARKKELNHGTVPQIGVKK